MKKNVVLCSMLVLVVLMILSCGDRRDEQQSPSSKGIKPVVLKVASVLPADHPTSRALDFFKSRIAELSGNAIEVKLFFNSQLGNAEEGIQNCQNGNIEMAFASAAFVAQFVPEYNALGMPFIFRDKAHEFAVVDEEIGKRLSQKLESIGLMNLCYFDAGSRNIMTKKGPITKPEDLKGMKIRVMSSKIMVDSINALGASAISMSQGEVYGALQTGVIDGWENNPPTTLSFKMYETGCIYYASTRHLAVPDMLLINTKVYQGLSEEHRAMIEQVSRETVHKQRELWKEDEKGAIDTLKENGMLFNDVDLTLFSPLVAPVYDEAYAKYGAEFEEICKSIKDLK